MPFAKPAFSLSRTQRELLLKWSRAHLTPQQVAKRCRIILLSDQGWSDRQIAKELGLNRHTCRCWRERFAGRGADSLWLIEPGRGRKPQAELSWSLIEATRQPCPKGQSRWTTRSLARLFGVHSSTVSRILRKHGIRLRRGASSLRSPDQELEADLLDGAGV